MTSAITARGLAPSATRTPILYRQWTQQHPIEQREDCRVRTDAECHHEHTQGREARRAPQGPPGLADVSHDRLDETEATRIATLFLALIEAADSRRARKRASFSERPSARNTSI
jgi:hypothetical protein